MGSREGAEKAAATRIGVTIEFYQSQVEAGLKWCIECQSWQELTLFGADRSRGDGRTSRCKTCRHVADPMRRHGGPPDVRTQTLAVEAVRREVRNGRMPAVRSLLCADCGKPARHYHHHLGYDAEHRLDVLPLCYRCHTRRHW